jgi:signal transduction histidine kinase
VVSLNIHLLDFDNLTRVEYNDLKNKIINLVNTTAESARQISHDLLPPVLEKFGLHAAIDALCSEINNLKPYRFPMPTICTLQKLKMKKFAYL